MGFVSPAAEGTHRSIHFVVVVGHDEQKKSCLVSSSQSNISIAALISTTWSKWTLAPIKFSKYAELRYFLSACSMYHNIQLRTLTLVRHLSLKMLRIRQLNTMLSVLSFKPSSPTVLPTSCPKVLFPCTYTMLVKNLLPNVRYLVR